MIEDDTHEGDGRRARTRQAITDALIRLMSERRYSAIRTTDVIETAGIGRSTFYEHFQSKDAVLELIVEPILMPLALAGARSGNTARLRIMLDHLGDGRALTRHLFEPRCRRSGSAGWRPLSKRGSRVRPSTCRRWSPQALRRRDSP